MSKCIKLSCKKCNYKVGIKVGLNYLDTPDMLLNIDNDLALPYNILSKLKTKQLKVKVVNMIHDGAVLDKTYGYEIMRCPECGVLDSAFCFTLKGPKETFSPTYYCKRCKHKLYKISETTLFKTKCPECHSKLECSNTIYYD